MELDKAELTRHLLDSAQTIGEVKGLVSQMIEHYKSFNHDRKQEADKTDQRLEKLAEAILKAQEENRSEIKQLVQGMTAKIDDYEELCNAKHEITKTEINNLKEDRAKIKGAMVATTLIGGAIGGVVGLLAKIGFKIGV